MHQKAKAHLYVVLKLVAPSVRLIAGGKRKLAPLSMKKKKKKKAKCGLGQ